MLFKGRANKSPDVLPEKTQAKMNARYANDTFDDVIGAAASLLFSPLTRSEMAIFIFFSLSLFKGTSFFILSNKP